MQLFIILAMLIALAAVVFALQNIAPVTVVFLVWTFQGSLALVLLIALLAGALITFLAALPARVKGGFSAASQNKRIDALEKDLDDCKQKLNQAQGRLAAEHGASDTAAR